MDPELLKKMLAMVVIRECLPRLVHLGVELESGDRISPLARKLEFFIGHLGYLGGEPLSEFLLTDCGLADARCGKGNALLPGEKAS
jgi:hypothetical protein